MMKFSLHIRQGPNLVTRDLETVQTRALNKTRCPYSARRINTITARRDLAETLMLEEGQREWTKEIKRVKESGLLLEQQIEQDA